MSWLVISVFLVAGGCESDGADATPPTADATSEADATTSSDTTSGDDATTSSDTTSGDDATSPPADTGSGEDAGQTPDTDEPVDVQTPPDGDDPCLDPVDPLDPQVACDCFSEGDPCSEADAPNCLMEGFGPWCGEEMNFIGGCECVGGTWTCMDMQAPPLCHDCCQEAEENELYFCATDGNCIEAFACEAEPCCVPGSKGDTYCQTTFGDGSSCVAGESGGTCDPM